MKPGTKAGSSRQGRQQPFSMESYSRLLEKVFDNFLSENAQLDRERSAAPDRLSELIELAPSQRQLLIRNSPQHRAWPLMEEALGRCRRLWGEDPTRAEDLARLALEVATALEPSGFRLKLLNDLMAEIWSHIGNCKRIGSDLWAADQAFALAERYLADGTGDPMERARLLDLKSSLRGAQRDFEGAGKCLSEAITLYSRFPDRHAEGRARLKQATLIRNAGEPEKAIRLLKHAGSLIDQDSEPRLSFLLKWNLSAFLFEAEHFDGAQKALAEARELSRAHGTRHDRLRLLWLEGALRSRLGQPPLAEEALRQSREGFVAAGMGYEVALVSLDLAALYLENGRTEDVRRLAVETMPIFASRNVQRELLVAWQLFKEAAEKDVATLRLVDEVAAQIRKAEGAAGGPDPGS